MDIRPFLAKMDDPQTERRRLKDDRVETVRYQRTYAVYLITAARTSRDAPLAPVSSVRILLNRKGVRGIEAIVADELPGEVSSAA